MCVIPQQNGRPKVTLVKCFFLLWSCCAQSQMLGFKRGNLKQDGYRIAQEQRIKNVFILSSGGLMHFCGAIKYILFKKCKVYKVLGLATSCSCIRESTNS